MQTKLDELERRIERLEKAWVAEREPESTPPRAAPTPRVAPKSDRPRTTLPAAPNFQAPPSRREPAPPRPVPAPGPAPAPRPAPARAPKPPRRDSLEDLIGGRVLAWAGGLAVVAAVVFLFAMAISRGWLDEAARTVLGGAFSLGLAAVGVWLQERGKRSDAALTAMAAGAAGLFLTVTVATRVYDLVPAGVGVGLALLVGAATTVVALRWQSPVVAALGLIGGLLSPALVGAPLDGATVAVLIAATLAAGAVCLWMRWTWLSCATLALPAAQWIPYLLQPDRPSVIATVATLLAFGALGVSAAVGYDVRKREQRVPLLSAWLVAINALVVTGVGWWSLSAHSHGAADAWLVAMALVHLTLGFAARRSTRCAADLSLVAFALATITADVALERLTDGVPTVFGWLGGALVLGAVSRRVKNRHELSVAELGLGAHIAVAIGTALSGPASPMTHQTTGASAVVLLGLAATCLVTGRLAGRVRPLWRVVLDGVALGAVAYLTALSFDGPALVAAWAVEAVTLAGIARRTGDRVATIGAAVNLGLAGIHALAIEAPPATFHAGELDLGLAALALGSFAAAAVATARLLERMREMRVALDGLAIAAVIYLTAILLDGSLLAGAWAIEAVALAALARHSQSRLFAVGAVVPLGLVAIHALAFEAPVSGLFGGDLEPLDAATTLGSFAAACLLAKLLRLGDDQAESLGFAPARVLVGAAAIAVLHLVSLDVVDLFETTAAPISSGTFELPVYQQAQMALSATWALAGVGALIAGLLCDIRPLRLGALALLGVAAGKVFIFDLASLDALYRVGSFFALGLLLLIGAFAWQRIRPRPLPDLRTVPRAAR